MDAVSIHPGERAHQLEHSDFGRLAAAIDDAEAISWDRIGGPTEADVRGVEFLERRIARHRPAAGEDWEWLARRQARALENGWAAPARSKLIRLAM